MTSIEQEPDEIEAAEAAIVEAIRARPAKEREWIVARAIDEFPAPARIDWAGLCWGILMAVIAALLANVHGLSDFRRGLVVGFVALICMSDLWNFAQSVYYWAREKGDEPS